MKFELPSSEEPTTVTIGVDIKDIPKVKDKDFSITLNAYFMAQWRDTRLEINERNGSRMEPTFGETNETKLIPVNPEVFAKRLWLPDVGQYIGSPFMILRYCTIKVYTILPPHTNCKYIHTYVLNVNGIFLRYI